MSEDEGNWRLIESDPGLFTELIKGFGCDGVQVEDIWSLDPDVFKNLQPIHGLIFLFKWEQDDDPAGTVVEDNRLDTIFFAKQVVNNACATQTILSILLNSNHKDIELGETLTNFKEFCQSFDAFTKGLTLANASQIRDVHNSFERYTFIETDAKGAEKDDDQYHFISYMPIGNHLYELDGLRDGPVDHGAIEDGQDWIDVVRPIIEKRMQKYREGEIHFNLMALVSDRQKICQQRMDRLIGGGDGHEDVNITTDEERQAEIARLRSLIEVEIEKRERYKDENMRRRHNYLPLIVDLLKILGQKRKLMPIYQEAKEHAVKRQKRS